MPKFRIAVTEKYVFSWQGIVNCKKRFACAFVNIDCTSKILFEEPAGGTTKNASSGTTITPTSSQSDTDDGQPDDSNSQEDDDVIETVSSQQTDDEQTTPVTEPDDDQTSSEAENENPATAELDATTRPTIFTERKQINAFQAYNVFS